MCGEKFSYVLIHTHLDKIIVKSTVAIMDSKDKVIFVLICIVFFGALWGSAEKSRWAREHGQNDPSGVEWTGGREKM